MLCCPKLCRARVQRSTRVAAGAQLVPSTLRAAGGAQLVAARRRPVACATSSTRCHAPGAAEWGVLRVTVVNFGAGGSKEVSFLAEKTEGDAMHLRWGN